MSKIKTIKTSFNGGEISRQVFGRVDLESFINSNKRLENVLPTIYGSVIRRGGTNYITNAQGRCLLVEFKINKYINYVIEFGDEYIRFYRNRQPIVDSDNEIYEISSPYSIEDLFDSDGKVQLSWTQSIDVLYLCHANYPIHVLKRYADDNWVLEDLTIKGGPFDNVNDSPQIQLRSDGSTEGLVTINGVTNYAICTINVGSGTVIIEQPTTPEKTEWFLDGQKIYSTDDFLSLDEAITRLLGTEDGQNFNVTRNGNAIHVEVKAASLETYNGKVLRLYRNEIFIRILQPANREYDNSATFSASSSANVFEAEDVGKLIRLQYNDASTVMWEANKSVSRNDIRKSGNNYYKAITNGTTGTIKPVHTSGSVSDGGVVWLYVHSGYGVGTILEVVSASQAKVDADGYFPDFSSTKSTSLWEKGLIGKGGNFPNVCAFYKERFIFAISTNNGTKICASCAGDYNNFSDNDYGDILAENAITVILQGKYESKVLWMLSASKLLIGTNSEEFIFGEQTLAEVLSPTNVQCISVSNLGSADIKALEILDEMFFVSKDEKQIASLNYIAERDTFRPINISILFEHIFVNGVKCWSYTSAPYKTIWFSDNQGLLKSVSYDADNKVCAAARHDVGGEIESMCVIPSSDGNYDELWLSVKRTINNEVVRYIEVLSWGLPIGDYSNENKNKKQTFMDCSKVFVSSSDVSSVSGLNFLEGETVNVLVDGKLQADKTVSNGSITLDSAGKIIVVGLNIKWVIETLYLNLGGNMGTSQGLSQRVNKLMARCIDTRFIEARASGGNKFDTVVDKQDLTDDDFEIFLPSDYNKKMTITMQGNKAVNACILALIADVTTYE